MSDKVVQSIQNRIRELWDDNNDDMDIYDFHHSYRDNSGGEYNGIVIYDIDEMKNYIIENYRGIYTQNDLELMNTEEGTLDCLISYCMNVVVLTQP